MTAAGTAFILSGIACLGASGFVMYGLAPRNGKAASFWTKTDNRAMGVALLLVVMLVFGAGLLLKGLLG